MQTLQDSKRFKTGAIGASIIIVIGILQVIVPDIGNVLAQRQEELLMLAMLLMTLFGIEDLVLAFKGVPVVDDPAVDPPPDNPPTPSPTP